MLEKHWKDDLKNQRGGTLKETRRLLNGTISERGIRLKNNADLIIFHTAICAENVTNKP